MELIMLVFETYRFVSADHDWILKLSGFFCKNVMHAITLCIFFKSTYAASLSEIQVLMQRLNTNFLIVFVNFFFSSLILLSLHLFHENDTNDILQTFQ